MAYEFRVSYDVNRSNADPVGSVWETDAPVARPEPTGPVYNGRITYCGVLRTLTDVRIFAATRTGCRPQISRSGQPRTLGGTDMAREIVFNAR